MHLVLSIVVAAASFELVERQFLRLKDRLRPASSVGATAPATFSTKESGQI